MVVQFQAFSLGKDQTLAVLGPFVRVGSEEPQGFAPRYISEDYSLGLLSTGNKKAARKLPRRESQKYLNTFYHVFLKLVVKMEGR